MAAVPHPEQSPTRDTVTQFPAGFWPDQLTYAREVAEVQYEGKLAMALRQLLDLGIAAHAAQTPTKP